ncbi:hypothetical protein [Dactylosporangium sp. CA-092794]|uniref:hypothetical protein n=1 Tax=Dactylosporangium sp. CA-092794 TaxID=3239929 RepID=UPI003D92B386
MTAEFAYFTDPHVGKLLDLVLQLATELHVTDRRLRTLETVLTRQGVLAPAAIDTFEPDDREREALETGRDRYLDRLARIIAEAGPAEHPMRGQWEQRLQDKRAA